ncbi:DNA (cytosine-5-)-methyltransferase [Clostridium ganghwense]|uniref:DNA (cytosine-5-)-methyltransferase n=1 Tax=Clostridium ganghwense TaxID=312089 RepID=A0ABT4CTM5_9CLOT|nr:DNA (cytosine-5-)-methyltransferase [Clostridium ganghwense]MCY6372425.1 DNA (cytosine-5-)-methyltransferase [Clostridium ganghwense]
MKFLDLFSGIGGFRLGMEMAGHECVGHCEIDKYANKSYMAIHDVKEDEWYADDIRNVIPGELPAADIYCGGFPCQAFSIAGKQRGFEDTRGTLFFEIMRLAKIRKPKYLFLENVKGLLSHNGGRTFGTILQTLWACGYNAEWQVCNSKNFGVPQNRKRVFIIGHLRGESRPKIFPIGGSNSKTLKQLIGGSQGNRIYASDGLSCTLASEAGGRGAKTGLYLVGNINPSGKGMNGNIYDSKGISPTITTNKGEGQKILVNPVLTPNRINKRQNGRRIKEAGEPMFTLTAQDQHGIMISKTVRASGRNSRDKKHTWDIYNVEGKIRRLTPLECWRLQGFPDEHFQKAKKVNSDSQLYKQAGNSVTVNVIYEIAKRLD